jgi:hypothetical protein
MFDRPPSINWLLGKTGYLDALGRAVNGGYDAEHGYGYSEMYGASMALADNVPIASPMWQLSGGPTFTTGRTISTQEEAFGAVLRLDIDVGLVAGGEVASMGVKAIAARLVPKLFGAEVVDSATDLALRQPQVVRAGRAVRDFLGEDLVIKRADAEGFVAVSKDVTRRLRMDYTGHGYPPRSWIPMGIGATQVPSTSITSDRPLSEGKNNGS